jgi:hypothetical protein
MSCFLVGFCCCASLKWEFVAAWGQTCTVFGKKPSKKINIIEYSLPSRGGGQRQNGEDVQPKKKIYRHMGRDEFSFETGLASNRILSLRTWRYSRSVLGDGNGWLPRKAMWGGGIFVDHLNTFSRQQNYWHYWLVNIQHIWNMFRGWSFIGQIWDIFLWLYVHPLRGFTLVIRFSPFSWWR